MEFFKVIALLAVVIACAQAAAIEEKVAPETAQGAAIVATEPVQEGQDQNVAASERVKKYATYPYAYAAYPAYAGAYAYSYPSYGYPYSYSYSNSHYYNDDGKYWPGKYERLSAYPYQYRSLYPYSGYYL